MARKRRALPPFMGPIAVLTMAENAPPTDSTARQPLHPFFAPNRLMVPATDEPLVNGLPASTDDPVLPPHTTASDKLEDDVAEQPANPPSRRRKADQEIVGDEAQKKTRPRKRTRHSAGGGIANHFVKLGKDSESTVDKPEDDTDGLDLGAPIQKEELPSKSLNEVTQDGHDLLAASLRVEPPTSGQPISNDHPAGSSQVLPEADSNPTKPKKLLQFNPKTGTIGSPPKPKEARAAQGESPDSEKKTRPRRGRKPTTKIVRITYGNEPKSRIRIGELINAIISSQIPGPVADSEPSPPSNKKNRSSRARKPIAPKSSKSTHPFFSGQTQKCDPALQDSNPKKPDSSPAAVRTKQYSSTPCSPRKPRVAPAARMPIPQFGVKNSGLKFPGAKLPAWPWQGTAHVRGDGCEIVDMDNGSPPFPSRKSKGNVVKVSPDESIVGIVTQSMEIEAMAAAVRNINTDELIPPPPELRLPQKHFESGSKLQSRITPELRTFQPSPPSKKSALHKEATPGNESNLWAPPQLARLFGSISTSLSAFDMSQCETANWVQKYAPMSAAEVLQPGREAFLLRDWLQALMVQAVDTGSAEAEKPKAGLKAKGAGKKKRRKRLDGFIVSSEDEDYELHELSEEEDNWAPSGSRGILRKTVVRSGNLSRGKDGDKTANALIISGPHGCGKTAAVYAVAKELDFEVFEINPSSRRSGKDVLEKIGDMTRNHHVQHQSTSKPDDQDSAAEDDVAKDIKSGKQSTMGAFFKPKPAGGKPKQPVQPSIQGPQSEIIRKEPAKTQKQSLILLEEIDILYDEDKQFWTTVVGLIAQSKRPFIMTCNDETLVPLHTLRLHGIFRLSPPPRDLAVDRLVLVAANEGHALTRQSVEQLYDSRNCDLRAATMDLQYWCQIGVGDRRGGFDWFYSRWPKGVDLDENKEVVRVISQGTYQPGMNLLARDTVVDTKLTPRLVEDEIFHQTWKSWGLDIGDWQSSVGLKTWAQDIAPTVATPADRLGVLEAYDDLAEAMSTADLCSDKSFAVFKEVSHPNLRACLSEANRSDCFQEAIDATQPEPPSKIRDDFVLGLMHLDSPLVTRYDSLATSIASTLKSYARSSLLLHTERLQKHSAAALSPVDETQAIRCLQTKLTSTLPGTSAVNRIDFAFAFDPIAAPETSSLQSASYLEPSVFDRTLKLIALDVAPYVRSIVAYESHLQKQRLKMSNLVSEGGKGTQGSKRMRTTRAALSALEGGSRSATRGERWFKADMNPYLVAKTAGEGWNGFGADEFDTPEKSGKTSTKSSLNSSPDTTPTNTPKKVARKGRKRQNVLEEDDVDELA